MFQGSIYIAIVFLITHIMNKYREPLTHGVTGIIWRLVALLHEQFSYKEKKRKDK